MCLQSGWSENKSYDWVCDLLSITSLTSFCNFPAQEDFGFSLTERAPRRLPFWWEKLVTPLLSHFWSACHKTPIRTISSFTRWNYSKYSWWDIWINFAENKVKLCLKDYFFVVEEPVCFTFIRYHICKEHASVGWAETLSLWVAPLKKFAKSSLLMPNILCLSSAWWKIRISMKKLSKNSPLNS